MAKDVYHSQLTLMVPEAVMLSSRVRHEYFSEPVYVNYRLLGLNLDPDLLTEIPNISKEQSSAFSITEGNVHSIGTFPTTDYNSGYVCSAFISRPDEYFIGYNENISLGDYTHRILIPLTDLHDGTGLFLALAEPNEGVGRDIYVSRAILRLPIGAVAAAYYGDDLFDNGIPNDDYRKFYYDRTKFRDSVAELGLHRVFSLDDFDNVACMNTINASMSDVLPQGLEQDDFGVLMLKDKYGRTVAIRNEKGIEKARLLDAKHINSQFAFIGPSTNPFEEPNSIVYLANWEHHDNAYFYRYFNGDVILLATDGQLENIMSLNRAMQIQETFKRNQLMSHEARIAISYETLYKNFEFYSALFFFSPRKLPFEVTIILDDINEWLLATHFCSLHELRGSGLRYLFSLTTTHSLISLNAELVRSTSALTKEYLDSLSVSRELAPIKTNNKVYEPAELF